MLHGEPVTNKRRMLPQSSEKNRELKKMPSTVKKSRHTTKHGTETVGLATYAASGSTSPGACVPDIVNLVSEDEPPLADGTIAGAPLILNTFAARPDVGAVADSLRAPAAEEANDAARLTVPLVAEPLLKNKEPLLAEPPLAEPPLAEPPLAEPMLAEPPLVDQLAIPPAMLASALTSYDDNARKRWDLETEEAQARKYVDKPSERPSPDELLSQVDKVTAIRDGEIPAPEVPAHETLYFERLAEANYRLKMSHLLQLVSYCEDVKGIVDKKELAQAVAKANMGPTLESHRNVSRLTLGALELNEINAKMLAEIERLLYKLELLKGFYEDEANVAQVQREIQTTDRQRTDVAEMQKKLRSALETFEQVEALAPQELTAQIREHMQSRLTEKDEEQSQLTMKSEELERFTRMALRLADKEANLTTYQNKWAAMVKMSLASIFESLAPALGNYAEDMGRKQFEKNAELDNLGRRVELWEHELDQSLRDGMFSSTSKASMDNLKLELEEKRSHKNKLDDEPKDVIEDLTALEPVFLSLASTEHGCLIRAALQDQEAKLQSLPSMAHAVREVIGMLTVQHNAPMVVAVVTDESMEAAEEEAAGEAT
eukprot:CAMPEP_0174760802 /NCGR_PEP_ID=MMETSP1094-20130205/108953_1 /TAXON_ID=156173 /ORGANISM="Chrysochromulina brevifilum, Strain UTEX LB 985" /LENGTH=601 /DNA_ID=CAMNT_0015966741 /DNA_START=1 /DNA_END=1802 /DNA_ORIENTATION=-